MRPLILLLCAMIALPPALSADDGAASIGAGGIILMKREPRIVMAKEVLNISPSQVLVDYDFRNESDDDITTEVAFPIPAYEFDGMSCCNYAKWQGFDDFKLWINDVPVTFKTETRAFVGRQDITALLAKLAVDAGSFGHYQDSVSMSRKMDGKAWDIERLNPAQRQRLVASKAIDGSTPAWRVEKKYHWTQTFPARSTVHIRHQYTPVLGNSNTIGDVRNFNAKSETDAEFASLCPTPELLRTLKRINNPDPNGIGIWMEYVDFVLTTANTWKTPIEDFTLIVERPSDKRFSPHYVSFCWDGPVTKIDADHFSAHVNGLVPSKELRIGFLNGPRQEK